MHFGGAANRSLTSSGAHFESAAGAAVAVLFGTLCVLTDPNDTAQFLEHWGGAMTAEIAILNRSAVALAADSVVTLVNPRGRKTYDSAEKIFELSRFQPLALMIYNNAQFMNAPLDILARRFRETLTSNQIARVEQLWDLFSAFLLKYVTDPVDEYEHFHALLAKELEKLQAMWINRLAEHIDLGGGGQPKQPPAETGEAFIVRKIEERRVEAEGQPLDTFLSDITLEHFVATYRQQVEFITRKSLAGIELTDAILDALTSMAFAIVKSRHRTQSHTGYVFAGFGYEELFPTLHAVECDGIYFRRFRILKTDFVDIDRRGQTAKVMMFAQKDMPERFIFGIDAELESGIEKLADTVVAEIVDKIPDITDEQSAKLKSAASGDFRQGLTSLKGRSEQSLMAIVDHLSKQELADVAHSLIELTSRKRRYSTEVESVGGPVDVAVLTSNEGFVWVKRKHYFDAALNPRYFAKVQR
ncbi:MAG: hypothetical protein ABMA14_17980 [Hyphomonadaceae bacterium]